MFCFGRLWKRAECHCETYWWTHNQYRGPLETFDLIRYDMASMCYSHSKQWIKLEQPPIYNSWFILRTSRPANMNVNNLPARHNPYSEYYGSETRLQSPRTLFNFFRGKNGNNWLIFILFQAYNCLPNPLTLKKKRKENATQTEMKAICCLCLPIKIVIPCVPH